MKKTITLSAFALSVFIAQGQTSKGSWLVGGGLAYTSSTEKQSGASGSSSTTIFQLTPDFGYFFIDNLAAGLGLNLNSSDNPASSSGGISTSYTIFTAGPIVRYYFGAGTNLKFFLHADAAWGSAKLSINSGGVPDQPSLPISEYEGKAGAAIFLNKNVALEFSAGYQSMTEKDNTGGDNLKYITGSVILGLGFQVYLGPVTKKK